jgi:alpha,alpha-trehalase
VSAGARPAGAPDSPPLSSYAFLSDTHTGALVGADGAVEWMCTPQFDGPSAFGRVLDRERGGAFEVGVDGEPAGRRYLPRSFVHESTWDCGGGATAVLTDALAIAPGDDRDELTPRRVLVRRLRATGGPVTATVRVDLRPDYARQPPQWSRTGDGWREAVSGVELRAAAGADPGDLQLRDGVVTAELRLADGEQAVLQLGYEGDGHDLDGDRLLAETATAWQEWCAHDTYDGIAAEHVVRSALVLRALSFDRTGALLAAPTTSLPEDLGGERNYDYRFTWHRDASLHVLAMFRLGHGGMGRRYLRFLLDHAVHEGEPLKPMVGLDGQLSGDEEELDHLEGYAGSRPVRIGNEAFEQTQLDSYGHVLDAAYAYSQLTGELTLDDWRRLRWLVEKVVATWREPDKGLWEVRGPDRHFVNSKVMAWVTLDRGIRLAEDLASRGEGLEDVPLDDWRAERAAVHAEVLERGWDDSVGAFVMAYDDTALDASLLRMPLVGFLPGDDPRVVATIERVAEGLAEGDFLVHRYDTDVVDDGLAGSEGAFVLCSFELVSALALAGRFEQARRRFDAIVASAGPLGLLSEQLDADGLHLGNTPQAFSHLALIEAAANLTDAERLPDGERGEALHDWATRSRTA